MKKVMTMRIIGVLLIVLAYSIPAFAHEPNPAQDFYCGNQFVTFFVVVQSKTTTTTNRRLRLTW